MKTLKLKELNKPSVGKKAKIAVGEKPLKLKELDEPFVNKPVKAVGAKKPYFLKIIIALIVIVLIVAGIFYAFDRAGYINLKPTDQQILAQLKKIIVLPDNVTPTMAVVTNAETLKKQQPEFFANVKNGDRLIIYPDLVILYDYNANKIIKVEPVQTAQSPQK